MKHIIHITFGFLTLIFAVISAYAVLTDDVWFAFKLMILALNSLFISALASNANNGKNSNKKPTVPE